eukprot:COSAG05_NODE_2442_length_3057_cov_2.281324_4_plen_359_part_00
MNLPHASSTLPPLRQCSPTPAGLERPIDWNQCWSILQGRGTLFPPRPCRVCVTTTATRQIFVESPKVKRRPAGCDQWLNSGGVRGATDHWFTKNVGMRRRYGKFTSVTPGWSRSTLAYFEHCMLHVPADGGSPEEDLRSTLFILHGAPKLTRRGSGAATPAVPRLAAVQSLVTLDWPCPQVVRCGERGCRPQLPQQPGKRNQKRPKQGGEAGPQRYTPLKLLDLSDDVLATIASHLGALCLGRLNCVCRRLVAFTTRRFHKEKRSTDGSDSYGRNGAHSLVEEAAKRALARRFSASAYSSIAVAQFHKLDGSWHRALAKVETQEKQPRHARAEAAGAGKAAKAQEWPPHRRQQRQQQR